MAFILRVQGRVLAASPEKRGIPLNQPRGWMVVDSKTRWAGLTADAMPGDLAGIREDLRRKWSLAVKAGLPEIYDAPFTWVYGLYSRHGRFYPPYDPIPDLNWSEMAQNLNI